MTTHEVDQRISELALRQAGAFSARQAESVGANRKLRHRRVAAGRWIRPTQGVIHLRDHPITWHTRLWIALLEAGGEVTVSHRSAAQLLGLPGRWRDPVEVTKWEGRHHQITQGRLHESSWIPPEHLTTIE